LVYLIGKTHDFAGDAFVFGALRRMQNGGMLDQLLDFAVSEIFGILGCRCPWAVKPLLALALGPGTRAAISESIYRFLLDVITGQSPTGSRDGPLVYDGPVEVPMEPGTFRLPQGLSVSAGRTSAEITWHTRRSAETPALRITDKDGNPAPEVQISIESRPEEVMAEQLDIGLAKLLGRVQPVLRHTARLTGLEPGKAYRFTVGDSAWAWWGEPQQLLL